MKIEKDKKKEQLPYPSEEERRFIPGRLGEAKKSYKPIHESIDLFI